MPNGIRNTSPKELLVMSRTKLRTIIALAIISLSLFAITVFAQQNTREIFERARMLDESNQNLSEAIKLYGQVVSQSNEQRALAARAQYRIGVLYERMGRKAEAQRAFQTVVRQYGDQPEAGRARAKIPASAKVNVATKNKTVATESSAPTVRQIWAGADVDTEGAPSPDGRYLSFEEKRKGNLAIRDLVSGESHSLTNDGTGHCPACAYESIWSPDGKQIVYGWLTKENDEKYKAEALELRIINVDGSGKRVLYRPDGPIYAWPFDWSPDGKHVLVGLQQDSSDSRNGQKLQLALMSVADGTIKPIKNFPNWDWRLSGKIFFSPDGNYIVYSAPQRQDAPQRDVYILAVDGGEETPLIEHDADDYSIGWTHDGRGVLFISDRLTTFDVWFVPVKHGKAEGPPELVKRSFGNVTPMGITKTGALFYSPPSTAETNMRDVYVANLDASTHGLVSPPVIVTSRYPGSNYTTAWSSDGRLLAMRSHTKPLAGNANDNGTIVVSIVSPDSKETRTIRPKLDRMIGSFYWARDGRSLFVAGAKESWEPLTAGRVEDRQGIYRIDPQTGDATPVIQAPSGTWLQYPVPGIDGKSLFYIAVQRSDATAEIRIRNLESGEDRALFKTKPLKNPNQLPYAVSSLNVSPDGQRIVFTYENNDFRTALMSMPASGGEARELIADNATSVLQKIRGVAWTPDGKYILFTRSTPNGRRPNAPNDLWRIPAGGGDPVKLSLTFPEFSNLSMNPDGQRLAFVGAKPATREVWVMENFLPKESVAKENRPHSTLVWEIEKDQITPASVSAEGRYISFTDWNTGNLLLRDLATNQDRVIVAANNPKGGRVDNFVEASTISRDLTKVAYSWYDAKTDRYELWLANLRGDATPRRVGDPSIWIEPSDWSPDGKSIAINLDPNDGTNQIAVVSVEDGKVRMLKAGHWPGDSTKIFFSPDGKYIAYDLPQDTTGARDVWVTALDGTTDSAVVAYRGNDIVMGWSADGQRLLFATDRMGSMALWSAPVLNGALHGEPELLKPDMGLARSMGVTTAGTLFYGTGRGRRAGSIKVAQFDIGTGVLTSAREVSANPQENNANPTWSPDGKYLAYLSERGRPGATPVIVLRTANTGGLVREIEPKIQGALLAGWKPDGKALLVTGRDFNGSRYGAFRVDVETGDVSFMFATPWSDALHMPAWSADGQTLYYWNIINGGNEQVFVAHNIASAAEKEIVRRPFLGALILSPDGRFLATETVAPATNERVLLLVPLDGTAPREVMRVPAGVSHQDLKRVGIGAEMTPATWAPDSQSFIARLKRAPGGESELWQVPIDGTAPRKLASRLAANVNKFTLSPDGRQVAFRFSEPEATLPRQVWKFENFTRTNSSRSAKRAQN
jgi:Tol biopolymer transport system component